MSWGPDLEVTTARDGGFTFEKVTKGTCWLFVTSAGYATARADVTSGDTSLELVLRRAASVEGTVVDVDARPVAARVLRLSDPRVMPLGEYQADDVDASGRFRYDGRSPGRFKLRAITEDGREGEIGIDVTEGAEIRELRLQVAPPWRSQLRLRVRVGVGTPQDVSFQCDGDPRVERQGEVATLLLRVPPGTGVPVCIAEDRRGADENRATERVLKTTPLTDDTVIDVLLPELVTVKLEANVTDVRAVFEHGFRRERAQEGGTWLLSPECAYTVKVRAKGFVPEEVKAWRPPPGGGLLAVRLRKAGAIRGVVVDEEGTPAGAVDVRAGRAAATTKTDGQGRFVLDGLPDGDHVVLVERDYMKIAAARVHVSEGATADAGTIVARPSRRIRGSVIDHMRRPVGGAKVSFVSVLRGERYPDSMRDTVGTYTHANGSFEFEAPAVDGFLLAEKTGFGTIPSALENASEIVLPPPAFVRVDATAAAKANDLLWTCSVRWPDLVPEAIWRVGYFLPHTVSVAPGRVEVIGNFEEDRRDLEPGAAGIKSRTIDILEGQTTSVTFDR